MAEIGVEKIEWITARDERVRGANPDVPCEFSHVELDSGTYGAVKFGTPFNNGEDILYPHDPAASAGNVINCRCVTVIASEKE
jgi:uncharacterized protein with gpF-like domain